jgi:hypothetical protein
MIKLAPYNGPDKPIVIFMQRIKIFHTEPDHKIIGIVYE